MTLVASTPSFKWRRLHGRRAFFPGRAQDSHGGSACSAAPALWPRGNIGIATLSLGRSGCMALAVSESSEQRVGRSCHCPSSSGAPRSRPPKGGPLSRQRLLLLCQLKSASRAGAAAEAEAAREPPKEHCLPGSPWQCPRRQRLLAQQCSSSRSASRSRSPCRSSSRLRSSRTCLACCWVLRSRLLPPPLG